jgi:cytochrome c oxidase subunit 3
VAADTQAALEHPEHPEHHAAPGHAAGDGHGHGDHLLQHQFDDLEQQRESNTLGMWLFLATEVMMFGGLFFVYSLYRMRYPAAYHIGSHHLNHTLGFINTLVLLVSSLTMAMAVYWSTQRGGRAKMIRYLALTWLLGFAFLGIKAVEWTADYREGLIPAVQWTYGTEAAGHEYEEQVREMGEEGRRFNQLVTSDQVMMYFVVYFCMTGLHGIHMVVGLGLVAWFIVLARRGQFREMVGGRNDQPVEILGLYWHLVDIIWVFLFPLLYLIAGFHFNPL